MNNRILAFFLLLTSFFADAQLETFATLTEQYPSGNIAVSQNGRVFMSVHEFYGHPTKFVEVFRDGTVKPYPNNAWSIAPKGDGLGLTGVLGVNIDREGILWMLDGGSPDHAGRIVAWNTVTESLHRIIYLTKPVARSDSFLNDLAVDREHEAIYIADTTSPGNSAIIIIDLKTGRARRVMQGQAVLQAEDRDIKIDGRSIQLGGQPARIGVNPITIDPSNHWVYFGAMSGTKLYRVKTTDLLNESLSDEALADRVELYGNKPFSDGITVDNAGNVYITAIEDNALGVVKSDGQYQVLHQNSSISWPDGFAIGPDNKIYVTINELHHSPVLNDGKNEAKGQFKIMRFDALSEATPGR